MKDPMNDQSVEPLLAQACGGDRAAFDRLFDRFRAALRQFIDVRLDRQLRARLDPSDVVQEAQLEAFQRLAEFVERRPMPFRVWLHKTARQRLAQMRRHHLAAVKRSARREKPLPDRTSVLITGKLIATSNAAASSPTQHLARREASQAVGRALAALPEIDREILVMRTVDGLSYDEAASILDIAPAAARKRYGRALLRLRKLLFESGIAEP
jgi:RNA polymerase sigma-70 factor (ECF subfamily)